MTKNYDQYRMDRFAAFAAKIRSQIQNQENSIPKQTANYTEKQAKTAVFSFAHNFRTVKP